LQDKLHKETILLLYSLLYV